MRDLDASGLISGDFLLLSGDVISNMNLELALAEHRSRREKNKNAIMTMILSESHTQLGHTRTKSRPLFVIDSRTGRCLHYDDLRYRRSGSKYLTMDPEIFQESLEINVRDDLTDCYIDICSQDVLAAWSDNFDFTSLRKSLLRGVLKDYETYGKTIHTYIVRDRYAARVKSIRTYDAVTRDVRLRRTYPLCPDSNLMPGQSYRFVRGGNYCESKVAFADSAVISKSMVGSGTSIGKKSQITGSTVGRGCTIGCNVTIDGAYIWDGVSIGDDVSIRQSIVADDVTISKGCTVGPNALVTYKERIDGKPSASQKTNNGQGSNRVHQEAFDDEDSDASSLASSQLVYANPAASISTSSISTLASSDEDFEPTVDTSRRSSFRSNASDDAKESRDFHLEATTSILDGLQKGDASDTIMLELSSYRMSTNASQHEVRRALVAALMRRMSELITGYAPSRKAISRGEAVKTTFTTYGTLIKRTMFDTDSELKSDQVDFLILVQKDDSAQPAANRLLPFIVKEAYDQEILEEDGILQWWEDKRSSEGEMGEVRKTTKPLVLSLQADEEDDESNDEDEEEEEEVEDEEGE